jgi:hypothetical protein
VSSFSFSTSHSSKGKEEKYKKKEKKKGEKRKRKHDRWSIKTCENEIYVIAVERLMKYVSKKGDM